LADELWALDVAIRPEHMVAPHYDRKTKRCVHDSTAEGGCDHCRKAIKNNEALKQLRLRLTVNPDGT
jgi:hypothetical protein